MLSSHRLEQPASLRAGQPCYLIPTRRLDQPAEWTPVTFLAYTACPAVVIVQAADGSLQRCSREDLYGLSSS